jgi:hypothetical protein
LLVNVLVALALVAWCRRARLIEAVQVAATAAGTYALYPLWSLLRGEFGEFASWKLFNIGRFARVLAYPPVDASLTAVPVQGSGAPFLENLLVVMFSYGTTYVLIAVGALFTLVLLLPLRNRPEARFLVAWSVLVHFYLSLALFNGRISDQFFYFLTVTSVVVVGYLVGYLVHPAQAQRKLETRLAWLRVLRPLLALIFLANGYLWANTYAVGQDNSYAQVYAYVRANVPAGAMLAVGSDVNNYLFSEDYRVEFPRSVQALEEQRFEYFIFSSKEAWGSYNGVTRELYAWILQNTTAEFERQGPSFWTLGLYHRELPPIPPPSEEADDAHDDSD